MSNNSYSRLFIDKSKYLSTIINLILNNTTDSKRLKLVNKIISILSNI